MLDDERPGRVYHEIWIATGDSLDLACARCLEHLEAGQVALYTRTRPGDPFDPWCPECAYTLVRWAGIGALETAAFDNSAARETMEALIQRGRK